MRKIPLSDCPQYSGHHRAGMTSPARLQFKPSPCKCSKVYKMRIFLVVRRPAEQQLGIRYQDLQAFEGQKRLLTHETNQQLGHLPLLLDLCSTRSEYAFPGPRIICFPLAPTDARRDGHADGYFTRCVREETWQCSRSHQSHWQIESAILQPRRSYS